MNIEINKDSSLGNIYSAKRLAEESILQDPIRVNIDALEDGDKRAFCNIIFNNDQLTGESDVNIREIDTFVDRQLMSFSLFRGLDGFAAYNMRRNGRGVNLRPHYNFPEDTIIWGVIEEDFTRASYICSRIRERGDRVLLIRMPWWRYGGLDAVSSIRWPTTPLDWKCFYDTIDVLHCDEWPKAAAEAAICGVPTVGDNEYARLVVGVNKIPQIDITPNLYHDLPRGFPTTEETVRGFYNLSKEPLVSICMNCYNRDGYIFSAVDAALSQSYENIEVVLVDDGSDDSSFEIMKRYSDDDRVRGYRLSRNEGIAESWNYAMRKSKGKYVIFTSSDNAQAEGQIFHLVYMAEKTNTDIVYSDYKMIGLYSGQSQLANASLKSVMGNNAIGPSFIIRREKLKGTRLLQKELRGIEDTALFAELLIANSSISKYEKCLYFYNTGDASTISAEVHNQWRSLAREMNRYLLESTEKGWKMLRYITVDDDASRDVLEKMKEARDRYNVEYRDESDCPSECGKAHCHIDNNGFIRTCEGGAIIGHISRPKLVNFGAIAHGM